MIRMVPEGKTVSSVTTIATSLLSLLLNPYWIVSVMVLDFTDSVPPVPRMMAAWVETSINGAVAGMIQVRVAMPESLASAPPRSRGLSRSRQSKVLDLL